MKRMMLLLIALWVAALLVSCGGAPEQAEPTAVTEAVTVEATEPPVKEAPEDVGFREEAYTVIESTAQDGTKMWEYYTQDGSNARIRFYCEYPDGRVSDEYYDPNGNLSHDFWYHSDGSGSGFYYGEDGSVIKSVQSYPDGEQVENAYFENGEVKQSISVNAVTGQSSEKLFYESGVLKTVISDDPSADFHSESGYYENGNLQCITERKGTDLLEQHFDAEGFLTYHHSKNGKSEIECITDETGALVTYIENGTVMEDPEILAKVRDDYNFRG